MGYICGREGGKYNFSPNYGQSRVNRTLTFIILDQNAQGHVLKTNFPTSWLRPQPAITITAAGAVDQEFLFSQTINPMHPICGTRVTKLYKGEGGLFLGFSRI